ncbi:hypothetical protein ACOAOH_28415 [Pseudomonas aeruginosa]|nr:hypothetical protein [Pseudomonas aeruginosa]
MLKDKQSWLVAVLLFVSGGVFFNILPSVSLAISLDWSALSAVGTVGAVLVSLGLAVTSWWNRRGEEQLRAKLVAARMRPVLVDLINQLGYFSAWYYFDNLDSPGEIEDVRGLVKPLRICTDSISKEDIERLVVLDQKSTGYLSSGIGRVEAVISEVERVTGDWDEITDVQKGRYRDTWGPTLDEARDHIYQAMDVIEKAVNDVAPEIDWSQVYADHHED